ncbi:MAG: hypothetical protein V4631_19105 [Pseudomonadota bacterium]
MNPYTPPDSEVASKTASVRHGMAGPMLGLAMFQLVWVAAVMGDYFTLVNTGTISAMGALISLVACVLLYAAVIGFFINSTRGKYRFVAAAGSFAIWFLTERHLDFWSYPFLMGFALAVIGCGATMFLRRRH